jgi:predicted N-acetyltransferase YhbS
MRLDFRQATAADSDVLLDLTSRAFGRASGSEDWLAWKRRLPADAPHFRLLMADGRPAGAARILREPLQVGRCAIIKGDVGHVCVDPDFQARGLGTALMKHCVEWMRENDFDISRLGGLTRFYSRFGWEPFPRRYVELPIEAVGVGASRITPDRYLVLSPKLASRVRCFNPASDGEARAYLKWRFNDGRTGAMAFPRPASGQEVKKTADPPPPQAGADSLQFVYEREGRLYGYLFAAEFPKDHSDFEAQVTVNDVAFDLDEAEAVEALLKHIMIVGYQRGAARVTTRLPSDPHLFEIMRRARITFKVVELQGSAASNMIQIIGLHSLLRKIIPELNDRLRRTQAPGAHGVLGISAKEQRAQLLARGPEVTITDGQRPNAEIATDHATLVKWVLGVQSFAELPPREATGSTPAWANLLATIFPREATASGPWG